VLADRLSDTISIILADSAANAPDEVQALK
jgi:hypothetical protein